MPLKISETNGINFGKVGLSRSNNSLTPRIATTTTAVGIFAINSVALNKDQKADKCTLDALVFKFVDCRNANAIGMLNAHESTT